jgi:hypothetical protein
MKLWSLALGVLFLIFVVGIVLIVAALRSEKRNPKAHAITTRRLLAFGNVGMPEAWALASIASIDAERAKVARTAGSPTASLGTAIGSAIVATRHAALNQRSTVEPEYWQGAVGITLKLKNGDFERVRCPINGAELGLALARVLAGQDLGMPAFMGGRT